MSSKFNRTMIAPHPPYVCTKRLPFPPEVGPCCPPRLNVFVDVLFLSHQPEHFDFRFAGNIYRSGTECAYLGTIGWINQRVEVHLVRDSTTHAWELQLIPYTVNGGYKMWPNPVVVLEPIDDIWSLNITITKWDAYMPPPAAKRCRCRIKT